MAIDGMHSDPPPWAAQLPALLTLLDALAKHAVEDTNAASLRFLQHLLEIENRVIAANQDTAAFLTRLETAYKEVEGYDKGRQSLDQELRQAYDLNHRLSGQVQACHRAMHSISATATRLEEELATLGYQSQDADHDGDKASARLLPLVLELRSTLQESSPNFQDIGKAGILEKLAEQDHLLDDVSRTWENLIDDYAALLRLKFDRNLAAQKAGAELEDAIRGALASAQTGDIIRQQIELVSAVILKMRDIFDGDASGPDMAAQMSEILADMSSSYVMSSQYEVHLEAIGPPASLQPAPTEDLPRFELF
ncbi:MAG: hypothetical protein ACPGNV_02750 [Mangrovicoccus sp.]